MISDSLWIFGTSRSGKTTRLVNHFSSWLQINNQVSGLFYNKNIKIQKNMLCTKFNVSSTRIITNYGQYG